MTSVLLEMRCLNVLALEFLSSSECLMHNGPIILFAGAPKWQPYSQCFPSVYSLDIEVGQTFLISVLYCTKWNLCIRAQIYLSCLLYWRNEAINNFVSLCWSCMFFSCIMFVSQIWNQKILQLFARALFKTAAHPYATYCKSYSQMWGIFPLRADHPRRPIDFLSSLSSLLPYKNSFALGKKTTSPRGTTLQTEGISGSSQTKTLRQTVFGLFCFFLGQLKRGVNLFGQWSLF